ncbi:MAG: alpha/beta fold hydrolase [Verrucomicrobia bacterium]|nr:alpha/beta fold hydrolase [Cytophagales bacterium]
MRQLFRKKIFRRVFILFVIGFLLFNVVAFNHAYKFTHFTEANAARTQEPKDLSLAQKLNALFFGITNPKPLNLKKPSVTFEEITIQSRSKLAGWYVKVNNPKGTFILFHGYANAKFSMLERANLLRELGYDTLLIDFEGCGDSEGNETTVGYREADDVKASVDFVKNTGENRIFLLGTSMGAVAIMRAIAEKGVKPVAVVLECPFGTMHQTVVSRFKLMKVPSFPFAGLLMFWGGIQTNFWAFSHNPDEYARKINCPALLMYGEKDDKVDRTEIDAIFQNLPTKKLIKTFPQSLHNIFPSTPKTIPPASEWRKTIETFIAEN